MQQINLNSQKLYVNDIHFLKKTEEWRKSYLRWLRDNYPWTTLMEPDGTASRYAIENDYVPRQVVEFPIAEMADSSSNPISGNGRNGCAGGNDLLSLFERQPLLTLAASPGQGKTWFMQKLMLEIIGGHETPLNRAFPHLVPIPVIPRDYPLNELKSFSDFLNLFWLKAEEGIAGFSRQYLSPFAEAGQFLYIIDGFSEMGETRQCYQFLVWLGEAIEQNKNGAFSLILDRPSAFTDIISPKLRSFFPGLFPRCTFAPLSVHDQLCLLEKHDHREHEQKRQDLRAQSLKDLFQHHPAFMRMARHPFALSFLSAPSLSDSEFPENRTHLLKGFIRCELRRLARGTRGGQEALLEQHVERAISVLARYAYDWQMNKRASCLSQGSPRAQLESMAASGDGDGCEDDSVNAIQEILSDTVKHSHLFKVIGDEKIEFRHTLFKEYLAAEHVLRCVRRAGDRKIVTDLFERLQYENWRETAHHLIKLLDGSHPVEGTPLPELNLLLPEHRLFLSEILGDVEMNDLKQATRIMLLKALIAAEIKTAPRITVFHALLRHRENHGLMQKIWEELFLNREWLAENWYEKFVHSRKTFPQLIAATFPRLTEEETEYHIWLAIAFCSPVSLDWSVNKHIASQIKEYKRERLFADTHHHLLSLTIQTTAYPAPLPTPYLLWQDLYFLWPVTLNALKSEGVLKLAILRFFYVAALFKVDFPRPSDVPVLQARAWAFHRDMKREDALIIPRAFVRSRLFENTASQLGLIDDIHRSWNLALKMIHTQDILVARNFARAIVQGIARDLAISDDLFKQLDLHLEKAFLLNRHIESHLVVKAKLDDVILSILFYLIACSMNDGVIPPPLKVADLLDGSETTWQEKMIKMIGFLPASMERESAGYESLYKENFWPANISVSLRKAMLQKGVSEVDFEPKKFFHWFNKMVEEIEREYLSITTSPPK